MIHLKAKVLQHGEVKVAKGRGLLSGTGEMQVLPMFEPSSGQKNRQVSVAVGVGVAHSTSKQGHGAVEKRFSIGFHNLFEFSEESGKLSDVKGLDD